MHFALGSESVIGFAVLALTRKLLDKDRGGGALVMLLAIAVGAALTLSACSSGPQLPIITTMVDQLHVELRGRRRVRGLRLHDRSQLGRLDGRDDGEPRA